MCLIKGLIQVGGRRRLVVFELEGAGVPSKRSDVEREAIDAAIASRSSRSGGGVWVRRVREVEGWRWAWRLGSAREM